MYSKRHLSWLNKKSDFFAPIHRKNQILGLVFSIKSNTPIFQIY